MTSPSSSSAMDVAAKTHRFWFIMYLAWIIFAAFVSAVFTGLLWRAGNKQQDAVIADANERTETVKGETEKLKNSNLALEKDVAEQRTKAADAEKALLELQQKLAPRHLTMEQKARLLSGLKSVRDGSIDIVSVMSDPEAAEFAAEFESLFEEAGWNVNGVSGGAFVPTIPRGLILQIRSKENAPIGAMELPGIFSAAGIEVQSQINDKMSESILEMIVGAKP